LSVTLSAESLSTSSRVRSWVIFVSSRLVMTMGWHTGNSPSLVFVDVDVKGPFGRAFESAGDKFSQEG
jgi:hypothetical protein